jgi:2-haloacid dehalogenase
MKLTMTPAQQSKLMDAYLHLKPWPDVVDALKKLKQSGLRIVTLSNFDDKMQRANVNNAGLMNLFDALLSTEAKKTFKPSPEAYALGMEQLRLKKDEIVFAAFAGWDAYGSKTFGYKTFWVNRLKLPAEELGNQADKTSDSLSGLVKFASGHE